MSYGFSPAHLVKIVELNNTVWARARGDELSRVLLVANGLDWEVSVILLKKLNVHTFDLAVPSQLEMGPTIMLRHEQSDEDIHGGKSLGSTCTSTVMGLVSRLWYLHAVVTVRPLAEGGSSLCTGVGSALGAHVVQGQRPQRGQDR